MHACNGFMCRIKKVGPAHVHKKGSSIKKKQHNQCSLMLDVGIIVKMNALKCRTLGAMS